jgi:hypothetical protein
MAQAETPRVATVRPMRQPAILAAVIALLLVATIGVVLLASGAIGLGASSRAGDFGSREWLTYRAGERAPLFSSVASGTSAASGAVDFRRCERDLC